MSTQLCELTLRRENAKAQTIALMAVDNLIIDKETDQLLSAMVTGELTLLQAIERARASILQRHRKYTPVERTAGAPRLSVSA